MRHLDLLKLVALSSCLAFVPVHSADAAPSSESGSSPALEATSASRAKNGQSLNGRKMNGRKANGRKMNGVSLGGHTIRTDGGMSVVSIRLPGAERRGR
jgi:hypothetical protein